MSDSTLTGPAFPAATVFLPEFVVRIDPNLSKAEVIRELVQTLADGSRIQREHLGVISDALTSREKVATTAMGKGLAFPHLRSPLVDDFCGAIGTVPSGIDFQSLDGAPTRLIILTLSPFEARSQHSEIIGRLSSLLNDKTLQYSLQTPRSDTDLLALLGLS